MRDVELARHRASQLSNADFLSLIFSLILSTDCFGGGISQACIKYEIRNLQVSNHQLSPKGFSVLHPRRPCPTAAAFITESASVFCLCERDSRVHQIFHVLPCISQPPLQLE